MALRYTVYSDSVSDIHCTCAAYGPSIQTQAQPLEVDTKIRKWLCYIDLFYTCVHLGICMQVCVPCTCSCMRKPEGMGVTSGGEHLYMGASNKTLAPWKSSQYS